jgi:hypothetical protein
MVNFNTQIHKFTAPVIARNVHNIKSPELAKFIMTNVHKNKSPESRHKMVITSKFHTNKLHKSTVGCVRPFLLLLTWLRHDITTLDASIPVGVGVEVVWAGSQAECPITENSQPHPNNVSWQDKAVSITKCWNLFVLSNSLPAELRTWPCWGMHPRQCPHRRPMAPLFVVVIFPGGLHPMKRLLQEPVVEWDDPHRRLWCSCSETPAVEHYCGSSTQKWTSV